MLPPTPIRKRILDDVDTETCTHLDQVREIEPQADGCVTCLEVGDTWFHLRLCMSCGYVGCCDTSRNKHASAHARGEGHPIIQSFEPDEDWYWCYVDEVAFLLEGAPLYNRPTADTEAVRKKV